MDYFINREHLSKKERKKLIKSARMETDIMSVDKETRLKLVKTITHYIGPGLYFCVEDKKINLYPVSPRNKRGMNGQYNKFLRKVQTDIEEVILSTEFTQDMKEFMLHYALCNGMTDMVRRMMQQGIQLTSQYLVVYLSYMSLHPHSFLDMIKLFLEENDEEILVQLTHFAIHHNEADVLMYLYENKKMYWTPQQNPFDPKRYSCIRVPRDVKTYEKILKIIVDYHVDTSEEFSDFFFGFVRSGQRVFVCELLLEKNISLDPYLDCLWDIARRSPMPLVKFLYPRFVSGEERLTHALMKNAEEKDFSDAKQINYLLSRGACASNVGELHHVMQLFTEYTKHIDYLDYLIVVSRDIQIIFEMYESHITGEKNLGSEPEHIYETVHNAYMNTEVDVFKYIHHQVTTEDDISASILRNLKIYHRRACITFLDTSFSIDYPDDKVDPKLLDFIRNTVLDGDTITVLMHIVLRLIYNYLFQNDDDNIPNRDEHSIRYMYDIVEELIKVDENPKRFLDIAIDNVNFEVLKMIVEYSRIDPQELLTQIIFSENISFRTLDSDSVDGYDLCVKKILSYGLDMQPDLIFPTIPVNLLRNQVLIKAILLKDYDDGRNCFEDIVPAQMRQNIIETAATEFYHVLKEIGMDVSILDDEIWAFCNESQMSIHTFLWLKVIELSNKASTEIMDMINKYFVEFHELSPHWNCFQDELCDWLDELLDSDDLDRETMIKIVQRCCGDKYFAASYPSKMINQYRLSICFSRMCWIINKYATRILGEDWMEYLPERTYIPRENTN